MSRGFLGSGVPLLEKLSLKNVILSHQAVTTFLNILTQGGFPKLNCFNLYNIISECVKIPLSDTKPLSKYGLQNNHLERLVKLENWNEVAEAYLALEEDILSKTKLNEADARSLIHEMLQIELNLSNNSLIGCLLDFLKGPISFNPSDLSNINLCSISDVRTQATTAQEVILQQLKTLDLSKNNMTNTLHDLLKSEFRLLKTWILYCRVGV